GRPQERLAGLAHLPQRGGRGADLPQTQSAVMVQVECLEESVAEIVQDDVAPGGGDLGPAADVTLHLRPKYLVVAVGVDQIEQTSLEAHVLLEFVAVEVAVLVRVETIELLAGIGDGRAERVEWPHGQFQYAIGEGEGGKVRPDGLDVR